MDAARRPDGGGRGRGDSLGPRPRVHSRGDHPVGETARSGQRGEGEGEGLAAAGRQGVQGAGRRMPRDPVQPLSAALASAGARVALRAVFAASVALALMSSAAGAEGRLQKVRGHLSVGYAKLVGDPSPAGSFAMGVGVDYPLAERWRIGLDLGYELLGGDIAERGSFVSGIDYSMVEFLAMTHYA